MRGSELGSRYDWTWKLVRRLHFAIWGALLLSNNKARLSPPTGSFECELELHDRVISTPFHRAPREASLGRSPQSSLLPIY